MGKMRKNECDLRKHSLQSGASLSPFWEFYATPDIKKKNKLWQKIKD
jgi:hypothetical protein